MSARVEGWGYFDLASEQEIFQIAGADLLAFLNKYITQDILRLAPSNAALGAFLTQKGKIVSDALVLNLPGRMLLIFPKGYGLKVQQHLRVFLDLADITMEATKEFGHWVLLGDGIPQKILTSLPGTHWTTDRFGAPGVEWLFPKAEMDRWRQALSQAGAQALSSENLEMLRISAGLPKMGVDMSEENLVAEVGLDKRATSFTKGCYLGQETTARVNTQGHVNRSLTRLRLEKPIEASLPLEVFQGDKAVGRVSSAVKASGDEGMWALGIIQTKAMQGPEPLTLAGGQRVELAEAVKEK